MIKEIDVRYDHGNDKIRFDDDYYIEIDYDNRKFYLCCDYEPFKIDVDRTNIIKALDIAEKMLVDYLCDKG